MFNSTRKAARVQILNANLSNYETLTISSKSLPGRFSLAQLYEEVTAKKEKLSKQGELENLLLLGTCLSNRASLQRESGDDAHIIKLSLWISKVILPDGSIIAQDELPGDDNSASKARALALTRHKSILGLGSLETLINQLSTPSPPTLDSQILLSLLAFTNARDAWSSPPTLKISHSLLSQYNHQTQTSDFIISFLLQSFIRLLFSKSKPAGVTSTGRKAMAPSAPLPRRCETTDVERSSKPWKYEEVYSITILGWVVENIPQELLIPNFHLFIPPLLTLLDDPSTPILISGSQILTTFLPRLPSTLLIQSGLSSVFEDALFPLLLYLPNLTPLSESLQLLPAVYEALGTLGDVRFEKDEKGMVEFCDRVMRRGVLMGYVHSGEFPEIVQLLQNEIGVLVKKIGIHSVKHLKDILPILLSPLTDPFSSSRPPLLLTSLKTLQIVILNCWPRLSEAKYRLEIIKSISLCWKMLVESESEDETDDGELGEVKRELVVTGRLFVRAVEKESDVRGEVGMLVEAEGGLAVVFDVGEGEE